MKCVEERRARRRLRRIERQARRLGHAKIAEDVAGVRRCAPMLYLDLSPMELGTLADDARAASRGSHPWGEPAPRNRSERRAWVQVAAIRDRAAAALQELLEAMGVTVLSLFQKYLDVGCDGCGERARHYYVTGRAGTTALCIECMRGFAAWKRQREESTDGRL